MSPRTPVNTARSHDAAARSIITRPTIADRFNNVISVNFTQNAVYRKPSGTGPVGAATMTYMIALFPTGRPINTQYVFTVGNAVASGGFGLRCILSTTPNVAYNGFIVDGGGTAREAGSVLVNANVARNHLVIYHLTYQTSGLRGYLNGVAPTSIPTPTGYTPRTTATGIGMGCLGNGNSQNIDVCGIVDLQIYEGSAATDAQVAQHVTDIRAALKLDRNVPSIPGMTLNYEWNSKDANGNTWNDRVAGVALPVNNASYSPEMTSIPAVV